MKTSKRRIDSRSGIVAAGLRDITALRIENGSNWTEKQGSIGISFLNLLGTSITYIHLLGILQVVHSDSKNTRPRCTPYTMARFAGIASIQTDYLASTVAREGCDLFIWHGRFSLPRNPFRQASQRQRCPPICQPDFP